MLFVSCKLSKDQIGVVPIDDFRGHHFRSDTLFIWGLKNKEQIHVPVDVGLSENIECNERKKTVVLKCNNGASYHITLDSFLFNEKIIKN